MAPQIKKCLCLFSTVRCVCRQVSAWRNEPCGGWPASWVVWVWGDVDVVFVWAWECVVMTVCVDLWKRGGGEACSQPPSGNWGWARAQLGQRESTEDLSSGSASPLRCLLALTFPQNYKHVLDFSFYPAGPAWEEPGSPEKPLTGNAYTLSHGVSHVKQVA